MIKTLKDVLLLELDTIVKTPDHVGKHVIGLVKLGNMIKLLQLLTEAKESFEQFAKNRLTGAEKIIANAKEKGGDAMLTYNHFNVKPSYYKKAIDGKFDKEAAKKEFEETYKKISLDMTQTEFQREVGRLEVIGELLIREK